MALPMVSNPWMQNGVATPAYSGAMGGANMGAAPGSQPIPDPAMSQNPMDMPQAPGMGDPMAAQGYQMPQAPSTWSQTDPRWTSGISQDPSVSANWQQMYQMLYGGGQPQTQTSAPMGGNGLDPGNGMLPSPPPAQPVMEPAMGGGMSQPKPPQAPGYINEPFGGGSLTGPRPQPGMNGMAGAQPSEPFRPMSNPAMPQVTPGNRVPMNPGNGGFNFIRGRQLPVRRTLFNQRTNSQEIPLLQSLFSASGQDPASAFGEFQEFLPKGNKASLTAF